MRNPRRRRKILAEAAEVQVRCGGQMHKISMTADGALSLENHPRHTAEGRAVCKALETLGDDKPRCFVVMAEWRRIMGHKTSYGVYPPSKLPAEMNALANRIRRVKRMRRSRRSMKTDPLAKRGPHDFQERAVALIFDKMQSALKSVTYKGYNAPMLELGRASYADRAKPKCQKIALHFTKKKPRTKKGVDPGDYWRDNFSTEINPLEWYRLAKEGHAVIDGAVALGYAINWSDPNEKLVRLLRLNAEGALVEGIARVKDGLWLGVSTKMEKVSL